MHNGCMYLSYIICTKNVPSMSETICMPKFNFCLEYFHKKHSFVPSFWHHARKCMLLETFR